MSLQCRTGLNPVEHELLATLHANAVAARAAFETVAVGVLAARGVRAESVGDIEHGQLTFTIATPEVER